MANKTIHMRMDINHLYECIYEVISNSRSKIARENRIPITVGLEILQSSFRRIAERAIEINDDVLIEELLNLHILRRTPDGN